MKQKIAGLVLALVFTGITNISKAQVQYKFTGEAETFSTELRSFMGPNLSEEQSILLNSFISTWDSTIFTTEIKNGIISASNSLVLKRMRPNPHFTGYLGTIMNFVNYDVDFNKLEQWITGLNGVAVAQSASVNSLHSFITTTGELISDSLLYSSRSASWKILSNKFSFENDSVFKIIVPETDLLCYTNYDSTLIYNTSGVYIPITQLCHGVRGRGTWEKAGYDPGDRN